MADVAFNTQAIVAALREAAGQGCRLAVFPELCLTGYSCADLFYQRTLLEAAAAALEEIALEAQQGRDRGRRRAAAGGGRQAVQLRGVHRRRAGAGLRPQDLPAHHQRVLRGALVHVGQPGDPAERRDRRAGGAVRPRSALCRATICRTVDRHRNLRGPVGGEPAQRRHGAGRRDGPAQPLGQQRAARQGRLPARPGAPAIGALPGGLPLRRGRAGRIDDRHGLGRALADRRERQRCWPRPSGSGSRR